MPHSNTERVRRVLSQERSQKARALSKFLIDSSKHPLLSSGMSDDDTGTTTHINIALLDQRQSVASPDLLELHMPVELIISDDAQELVTGLLYHEADPLFAVQNHTRPQRLRPNPKNASNVQRIHDNGNWEVLIQPDNQVMLEHEPRAHFNDAASDAMRYLAEAQKSADIIMLDTM